MTDPWMMCPQCTGPTMIVHGVEECCLCPWSTRRDRDATLAETTSAPSEGSQPGPEGDPRLGDDAQVPDREFDQHDASP